LKSDKLPKAGIKDTFGDDKLGLLPGAPLMTMQNINQNLDIYLYIYIPFHIGATLIVLIYFLILFPFRFWPDRLALAVLPIKIFIKNDHSLIFTGIINGAAVQFYGFADENANGQ
jgi:hypothetical protein